MRSKSKKEERVVLYIHLRIVELVQRRCISIDSKFVWEGGREGVDHGGGRCAHIRCDQHWIRQNQQHHPSDQQDLQRRHRSRRHFPQRHSGILLRKCLFLVIYVYI